MTNDFHTEVELALTVLRAGGVILYPTDTIWGLGCDATNEAAVKKNLLHQRTQRHQKPHHIGSR